MSTALLIRKIKSPTRGAEFILKDILSSDDIDQLGFAIEAALKRGGEEITRIDLDISDAHDFLFKPSRLIGLCSYYGQCMQELNKDSSLNLIINQRQNMIFSGLGSSLLFYVRVKEGVPGKRGKEFQRTIKTRKIIKVITMLCLLGLFFSIFSLSGTAAGLALFLSSSILIFEGYIVLKIVSNKLKFLKAMGMEEGKVIPPVETLVFSS